MKRHETNWVATLALAVLALNAGRARAEEPAPPEQPPAPETAPAGEAKEEAHKAMQVLVRAFQPDAMGAVAAAPVAKVKGAYLGVTTKSADATLRKQLQLPDGVGLVVTFVDPESPAKGAGLEVHDVLTRFDDQILINERQLLTLVRMKKPGENVTLTLVRGGKETKAAVAPAEKDVLPLDAFDDAGLAPTPGEMGLRFFNRRVPPLPGFPKANWTQAMALSDPKFNIQVQSLDGKPLVIAKDKAGNLIYQGAGEKVPEEVRTRLGDAMKFIELDLEHPPGDVLFLRGHGPADPNAPKARQ
ncbi:MAG: PDZ domain-containing protein [Planctomycetota bacterium]|nr:PDZ domain-containing protein [Planctomycetota bacterium]